MKTLYYNFVLWKYGYCLKHRIKKLVLTVHGYICRFCEVDEQIREAKKKLTESEKINNRVQKAIEYLETRGEHN